MEETQALSLGQEDSLEKEMATHSSIPVWEIPWREETGGLQSTRLQKSWTWLNKNNKNNNIRNYQYRLMHGKILV